jgi:hypothetical protein
MRDNGGRHTETRVVIQYGLTGLQKQILEYDDTNQ